MRPTQNAAWLRLSRFERGSLSEATEGSRLPPRRGAGSVAGSTREARFMSKHVVATVGEIPPGQRKLVTVRGRSIAVFNLGGEFFGLFNRCPHQGGPMCEGILTGLIEFDEPGHYKYSARARSSAAPGMAGNSTCAPARASASRRRSACAAIRWRSRKARAWCRDHTWRRLCRLRSRSNT